MIALAKVITGSKSGPSYFVNDSDDHLYLCSLGARPAQYQSPPHTIRRESRPSGARPIKESVNFVDVVLSSCYRAYR